MQEDRLFTVPFVSLSVAELAYFTGFGVAVFALPLYVSGELGAGASGAGLAFGVYAVSALLVRPLAGRLCDTRGRRPLLVGGALLCALGMAALPWAGSLSAVVAIRLVQGVAEAAFFVAGFAALADLAPPSRLGEAISYNSLGLYLGLTGGPLLAAALVDRWGFEVAWYAAAGLGVLAALLVALVGETRGAGPVAGGHGRLIHLPSVPISLGLLTCLAAVGGFMAFASLYAEDVGLVHTSLALVVFGGVVVVGRVTLARLPDRLPPLRLAAGSLVGVAAGLVLMAVWSTPGGVVCGAALVGGGVALGPPAFFTAVFEGVPSHERGAVSGTTSVFMDLGLGVGPIVLGVVAGRAGIPWALGAGALVALAGALWVARLQRAARAVAAA